MLPFLVLAGLSAMFLMAVPSHGIRSGRGGEPAKSSELNAEKSVDVPQSQKNLQNQQRNEWQTYRDRSSSTASPNQQLSNEDPKEKEVAGLLLDWILKSLSEWKKNGVTPARKAFICAIKCGVARFVKKTGAINTDQLTAEAMCKETKQEFNASLTACVKPCSKNGEKEVDHAVSLIYSVAEKFHDICQLETSKKDLIGHPAFSRCSDEDDTGFDAPEQCTNFEAWWNGGGEISVGPVAYDPKATSNEYFNFLFTVGDGRNQDYRPPKAFLSDICTFLDCPGINTYWNVRKRNQNGECVEVAKQYLCVRNRFYKALLKAIDFILPEKAIKFAEICENHFSNRVVASVVNEFGVQKEGYIDLAC